MFGPYFLKKIFLYISLKINSKNTSKIRDYVLYIIGFGLNTCFIYIYIYLI